MKKLFLPFLVIIMLTSCENQSNKDQSISVEYPQTKQVDTVDTYFGETVSDPYRWLEDDRSKETGEWVKAQNEVTFGYLDINQSICFLDLET